jgi:hypothetical protein
MKTLQLFARQVTTIPATTAWHLADFGEAGAKQELFRSEKMAIRSGGGR